MSKFIGIIARLLVISILALVVFGPSIYLINVVGMDVEWARNVFVAYYVILFAIMGAIAV